MKVKRSKQYRKLMQAFERHFDFRVPYQVLIDAPIIQDAARFKMRLGSMLENTLHGEISMSATQSKPLTYPIRLLTTYSIEPMITQCCIRHLYSAPTTTDEEKKQKDAWIDVAKQAERRRCGHHELEEPLSTLDCLLSVVDPKGSGSNKHRYVVATQDQEVRRKMRQVAGVPLVYINRSVMILEPMAAKSEKAKEADEKGKMRAGLKSSRPTSGAGLKRKRVDEDEGDNDVPDRAKAIAAAERDGGLNTSQTEPVQKKRNAKGPKGPNPLSVKKTKKEAQKPVGRQVEDERSTVRKAAKKDPQAGEKALPAEVAADEGIADSVADGARKRKRKRNKPREEDRMVVPGEQAGGEAEVAGAGKAVVEE